MLHALLRQRAGWDIWLRLGLRYVERDGEGVARLGAHSVHKLGGRRDVVVWAWSVNGSVHLPATDILRHVAGRVWRRRRGSKREIVTCLRYSRNVRQTGLHMLVRKAHKHLPGRLRPIRRRLRRRDIAHRHIRPKIRGGVVLRVGPCMGRCSLELLRRVVREHRAVKRGLVNRTLHPARVLLLRQA